MCHEKYVLQYPWTLYNTLRNMYFIKLFDKTKIQNIMYLSTQQHYRKCFSEIYFMNQLLTIN